MAIRSAVLLGAKRVIAIDNVPGRLKRTGDLWAKTMRRPNSLDRALARV
jgi:threonine dehydrogenase-like Zn-dependent dehydrogenase